MISERRQLTRATNGTGLTLAVSAAAAVGLGALVAIQPMAGIALAGLGVGAMLFALGKRLEPFFLGFLAVVLTGYAFFGRGFAYVGVSPLYIGEMLLGVALLLLVVNAGRWRLNAMSALLLLFMALGIIATVPYVSVYGIDALRDAVIWGYATFALAVAWTVRKEHFEALSHWYGKVLPWFVLAAPLLLIADRTLSGLPSLPGSGVPIVDVKPGDIAVHLTGAAAFLLLGLWARRSEIRSTMEYLLWPVWFIGFGLAGSLNRGGMTSGAIGLAVAFMLRPSKRMFRPIAVAVLLITVTIMVDPTIDLGGSRQISLDQITNNLKSVVDSSNNSHLASTREWRLRWWEDIVGYTVHGDYFWTGKGFGINLADADGYQVEADSSLRSPHNSHMTVLARMGVPGMFIWIVLQAGFGVMMLVGIRRAHRRNDTFWAQIMIWLLVYWLAMLVNSSFDVYLEGPQGGIWFWTLVGLGLAAFRIQMNAPAADERSESTPSTVPPAPSVSGAVSGSR